MWRFRCRLSLAQNDFGSFKYDPESPGAQEGLGACAASVHRVALADATRTAEREHELKQ